MSEGLRQSNRSACPCNLTCWRERKTKERQTSHQHKYDFFTAPSSHNSSRASPKHSNTRPRVCILWNFCPVAVSKIICFWTRNQQTCFYLKDHIMTTSDSSKNWMQLFATFCGINLWVSGSFSAKFLACRASDQRLPEGLYQQQHMNSSVESLVNKNQSCIFSAYPLAKDFSEVQWPSATGRTLSSSSPANCDGNLKCDCKLGFLLDCWPPWWIQPPLSKRLFKLKNLKTRVVKPAGRQRNSFVPGNMLTIPLQKRCVVHYWPPTRVTKLAWEKQASQSWK